MPRTASGRYSPRRGPSSPAAEPELAFVSSPPAGIWRVARGDDPLRPSLLDLDDADLTSGGNRFDSIEEGTLYFATSLDGCFAETLARFRPSARLLALLADDPDWRGRGFMAPGNVPADWRHRRVALRVQLPASARFLDVEHPGTHVVLTEVLAKELDELGYDLLDVGIVRGRDRRVTRLIADWAREALDEGGRPAFAGLRYLSRLGDYECWAVFDREALVEVECRAITLGIVGLRPTAQRFGLTIH